MIDLNNNNTPISGAKLNDFELIEAACGKAGVLNSFLSLLRFIFYLIV